MLKLCLGYELIIRIKAQESTEGEAKLSEETNLDVSQPHGESGRWNSVTVAVVQRWTGTGPSLCSVPVERWLPGKLLLQITLFSVGHQALPGRRSDIYKDHPFPKSARYFTKKRELERTAYAESQGNMRYHFLGALLAIVRHLFLLQVRGQSLEGLKQRNNLT